MVHVFFLLAQELCADRVEGITTQLVFTLHVLKDINLQTTVEYSLLGVALSESLGGEVGVLRRRLNAYADVRIHRIHEGNDPTHQPSALEEGIPAL